MQWYFQYTVFNLKINSSQILWIFCFRKWACQTWTSLASVKLTEWSQICWSTRHFLLTSLAHWESSPTCCLRYYNKVFIGKRSVTLWLQYLRRRKSKKIRNKLWINQILKMIPPYRWNRFHTIFFSHVS